MPEAEEEEEQNKLTKSWLSAVVAERSRSESKLRRRATSDSGFEYDVPEGSEGKPVSVWKKQFSFLRSSATLHDLWGRKKINPLWAGETRLQGGKKAPKAARNLDHVM